jgi:ADP-heptose:LPS heptosyltransferase
MNILISRTDGIGDSILTLPIAGALKSKFKDCRIAYLGSDYTESIVKLSSNIDQFLSVDCLLKLEDINRVDYLKSLKFDAIIHAFPRKDIAKIAFKAKIPVRIGTSHRLYNVFYCNKRLNFSRRYSSLHEAELNFKLLSPFGISIPHKELLHHYYGLEAPSSSNPALNMLKSDKINLILHPKSKGHGAEWSLMRYGELIDKLPNNIYRIFITGTENDKISIGAFLEKYKNKVINLCGKLHLNDFISFISQSDALLASSTGPLHIAAALGIKAVGLYPEIKPIDPTRWAPIGAKGIAISPKSISNKSSIDSCDINDITADDVIMELEK